MPLHLLCLRAPPEVKSILILTLTVTVIALMLTLLSLIKQISSIPSSMVNLGCKLILGVQGVGLPLLLAPEPSLNLIDNLF